MCAPLKRLQRFACAVLVAASFQGIQSVHADWSNFGTVSMTDATHPKLTNQYACYTDGRDIICDTGVGPIHVGTNGMINSGGMTVAGSVSASAVSATYVSATVLQINPSTMPCSTGLNGTIRYSSTSNTLEVCAGTTWSTLSSNTAPGNLNGSGSATAVAFWNGPGSLTYESATTSGLYWDTVNKRLGIGTNSPSFPLEISSSTGGIKLSRAGNEPYILFWDGANDRATFQIRSGTQGGVQDGMIISAGGASPDWLRIVSSTGNTGIGASTHNGFFPTATLQVSGTFLVSTTGQNSMASASFAVDTRGVSVSSIVHINGSAFSPIGAGGNAILSGTTAVSTSSAGSITMYTGGVARAFVDSTGLYPGNRVWGTATAGSDYFWTGLKGSAAGASRLGIGIEASDTTGIVKNLHFWTAGSERMIIDAGGTMWVGAASSYPSVQIEPAGAIGIKTNNSASGYWYQSFYRNGTAIGTISQNGTTGVLYNTTSDRRMKENITDTREGLQLLMQLPVRDFAFRNDPSHTIVTGFIAQELDKVFPEAVTTNGDNGETPLKYKGKPWSVDYGRVTPLIVKAVQDLKIEKDNDIVSLTVQLKAANDNIRELRNEIELMKRARR